MNRIATLLLTNQLAAHADGRHDTTMSSPSSEVTANNGAGVHLKQPVRRQRQAPRWPEPMLGLALTGIVTECLAIALLLVSANSAGAQSSPNGPEWDGKNHQPTQAGVVRREEQAGVRASPAQREQDNRTVEQLDQKLMHDEAIDPPSNHARPNLRP